MQWSEEEEAAARKKVEENSATRVAPEEQGKAGSPSRLCIGEVLADTPASQPTYSLWWGSSSSLGVGPKLMKYIMYSPCNWSLGSHIAFCERYTYGWHFKQDMKI